MNGAGSENIMLDSFLDLGYVLYGVKLTKRRCIMLSKKIIFFLLILILLPSFALSQTEEIKDYKVMRGDTLWDISGKELDDPFLWPKVWKENPEVRNPDRIYPNQTIRIPLYLLQKEQKEEAPAAPEAVTEAPRKVKVEEPKKVEPPKPQYLVDKTLLMAAGYISDSAAVLGEITGSPSGRNLYGNNDLVYVRTKEPVSVGDKFYVLQKNREVFHPVTRKKMGYLVDIRGIAEIAKFEYGQTIAKITYAFKEIVVGDKLDSYTEMMPPLASRTYRKPEIDGYVVETRNLRMLNSTYDIVYIDRGSSAGLETGDIIRTLDLKKQALLTEKHKAPNGVIQIINANNATAAAIVRSSTEPVTVGNLLAKEE